jgi:hypothetical protein
MGQEKATAQPPRCPSCGEQLKAEGDLLRCATHGEFFCYGPRLLVRVARQDASTPALMPWQTLHERSVG